MDTDRKPFIVASEKGIKALPWWLKKEKYNSWTWGGTDKNGNPMITLYWDWKPDSDWGKSDFKGIIIITNRDFRERALEIVEKRSS